MANNPGPGNQGWPLDTTLREVIEWAAQGHENALLLFKGAYDRKDVDAMDSCVRALRHVATRLDQFKRIKLKQWNSPARDTSQSETPTK